MKATHQGHCQSCGRLQRLPKGLLSLHGYTKTHGFFSGICRGAHYPPIEVSCNQLPIYIEEAQRALDTLETFVRTLQTPTDGPQAWFHTRQANPHGRWSSPIREWKRCTVTLIDRGSYVNFERDGDTEWDRKSLISPIQGKPTAVSAGYHDTLADVCTKANRVYANYLQHEVKSLKNYIAWQQERVKNWKSGPLLPIVHRDKEGFKPVEAPY